MNAKMKKSINKNAGAGTRGVVQIDVESNSEELLQKLENTLIEELAIEPSCYEEETEYGTLWSFFVPTSEVKVFNKIYKEIKTQK